MQSFNLSSLYVLSVMMIICAIAFILPEENLHLLFGVLLCIALLHIWCQKYFIYMLSPMVILFVYITVNLFIGGWAHFNGYVMSEKQLIAFSEWRNYRVSVIYYILSLAIIYFIDSCYRNKYADIGVLGVMRGKAALSIRYPFVHVLIAFPFLFIPFEAAWFGGDGDLSKVFVLVAFFSIAVYVASNRYKYRSKHRMVIYIIMIVLLAIISVNDKREAIFAILPILLIESYYGKWIFNAKLILYSFLLLLGTFVLILTMSISRGYGSFGDSGLLESFVYVLSYIKSDEFISSLMNNLEFNYVFFHSLNAVEAILNDSDLIEYGSTIVKSLFIAIPRSIFMDKPESIIHLYTNHYSPVLRDLGVSYPVNIISEMFWNFHFFGVIALAVISVAILKVYYLFVTRFSTFTIPIASFGMFTYMFYLVWVRGSGLDMYLVYVIFSFFVAGFAYLSYGFVRESTVKYKKRV